MRFTCVCQAPARSRDVVETWMDDSITQVCPPLQGISTSTRSYRRRAYDREQHNPSRPERRVTPPARNENEEPPPLSKDVPIHNSRHHPQSRLRLLLDLRAHARADILARLGVDTHILTRRHTSGEIATNPLCFEFTRRAQTQRPSGMRDKLSKPV